MQSAPQRPVPLFPLPNAVLFPRVVLPLRVFELRYRTMVRDALSGDRMIVMALLRPGWEADYYGNPEFYSLGCLGRFEQVEWLDDDCYNLRLRGMSRVRVGRIAQEYPYRAARVQVIPEAPMSEDDPLVQSECQSLLEAYRARGGGPTPAGTLDEETGYEGVVNTLCTYLPIQPREKLNLLEMDSVLDRGRRLRQILSGPLGPGEHGADPTAGN